MSVEAEKINQMSRVLWDVWERIADDVLAYREDGTMRTPQQREKATVKRSAVVSIVVDMAVSMGDIPLSEWRALTADEQKTILGRAFPYDCYGY